MGAWTGWSAGIDREAETLSNENPFALWVWTILASFAGALTALSFRPFVQMRRAEILLSLVVGASFAIFVGPWVATWIFGNGQADIRVLGGLFYLMASGSNILIPLGVKKLSGFFGIAEVP